jgi:hypothetical protein
MRVNLLTRRVIGRRMSALARTGALRSRVLALLQSVYAGLGDLGVLLGRDAGDADGANNPAIRQDRDAAFEHAVAES